MTTIRVTRLTAADREQGRALFAIMAAQFDEESDRLGDRYLERLLGRDDFWAMAAFAGDEIVGGLTAHVLPMTRTESSELFIFDVAVRDDHRREGVGRLLIESLRERAAAIGIDDLFVAAAADDEHAVRFYHALGGAAEAVTLFTFSGARR